MSRSLAISVLWFALAGWIVYRLTAATPSAVQPWPHPGTPIAVHAPPFTCELGGKRFTRVTAELMARAALGEPPLLTSYLTREFNDGFLVTLTPADPHIEGGGGLVWVDAETGCVNVLRLYQ